MARDTRHPNRIAALPKGSKHWNWSLTPSRLALHKRLHRKFGSASKYPCGDCGQPAKDWSLIGNEYTDNPKDYRPRCRSCHRKTDMTDDRKRKISLGLKKAYAEGRRRRVQ